jgi:TRAP-type mannitol/chloroaromatic compound transport system permease large subunit
LRQIIEMAGLMSLGLFLAAGISLLAGFPVAFTLAGVALIFALLGIMTGTFDPAFLSAFPSRVFGIMSNQTLIAVPVFVFMGVMLERSKLADQLLQALAQLMRRVPGGLGLAVMLVGTLMAASTGIVGATVVTMGLLIVMLALFLLGFILDFIEITYVVIPIVGPVLLAMGIDPVWLGVMIAINLQTSFLTPPFGFSLFYLRGVAPPEIATTAIYRGVIPFIAIQLLMLGLLTLWPEMATWLPGELYSS